MTKEEMLMLKALLQKIVATYGDRLPGVLVAAITEIYSLADQGDQYRDLKPSHVVVRIGAKDDSPTQP